MDWGCGPGRLIRHLPEIVGNGCKYFGTDNNLKSINWCNSNLPGIHFNYTLRAELPYPKDYFGVIYGISIFTHLSEKLHFEWDTELYRILKPDGIIFLTTQGDNFNIRLTPKEQMQYESGKLVVRGKVKEGHRIYSAFHPKQFMEELFCDLDILEHIVEKPVKGRWLPQAIWIVKKRGV